MYIDVQMCTHEDGLAYISGAPSIDDVMSYNLLTTLVFVLIIFFCLFQVSKQMNNFWSMLNLVMLSDVLKLDVASISLQKIYWLITKPWLTESS